MFGHMATVKQQRPWFAQKLEAAMREKNVSVRALAKIIRPSEPEGARRTLHRYLAGRTASPSMRVVLCEALGLEASALEPDGDEEEDESDLFHAAYQLDRIGQYALADRLRLRARSQETRTERVPS